jgi:hypothetical protein
MGTLNKFGSSVVGVGYSVRRLRGPGRPLCRRTNHFINRPIPKKKWDGTEAIPPFLNKRLKRLRSACLITDVASTNIFGCGYAALGAMQVRARTLDAVAIGLCSAILLTSRRLEGHYRSGSDGDFLDHLIDC